MNEGSSKVLLEHASRLSGFLFAAVYGAGFLITSIHHAQFGISEFGLLRARIFSSGLLFIALTALPMLMVARVFGIFGLRKAVGIGISSSSEHTQHLRVSLTLAFFVPCVAIAGLCSFLMANIMQEKQWGWQLTMAGVLLLMAIGLEERRNFDRHPMKCILAVLLAVTFEFIVTLRYYDERVLWLSVWFYTVGISAVLLYGMWLNPDDRPRMEWEFWAVTFLPVLLLLFASEIYGGMLQFYGGGAPMPVTLQLANKTQACGSVEEEVLLIEETGEGYYFLKRSDQKLSYFLRRDEICGMRLSVRGSHISAFGPGEGRPVFPAN